jgi:hypothetical protein
MVSIGISEYKQYLFLPCFLAKYMAVSAQLFARDISCASSGHKQTPILAVICPYSEDTSATFFKILSARLQTLSWVVSVEAIINSSPPRRPTIQFSPQQSLSVFAISIRS